MILKLESTERELHQSKSETSVATYRLEELMDQMNRLEQTHTMQLEEMSSNKSALESNHSKLLADLNMAFEQCSSLQTDLIAVQRELDSTVDENRALNRKLESFQGEGNTNSSNGFSYPSHQSQHPSSIWGSFSGDDSEQRKLGEELRYANEALKLYRTLNEELREMQSTLKSRLWEAEDRYEVAMQANSYLTNELSTKTAQYQSLIREKESLSFELSSLKSQLPSGVIMRSQMLQASLDEMKKKYMEAMEAKDTVAKAFNNLGKEMNSMRREYDSAIRELKSLQLAHRKSEEERNRSEAILMITNEELSEAQSKMTYHCSEVKQLERQLEHALEDCDQLKNDFNMKTAELEDSRQLILHLKASIDSISKDHETLVSEKSRLEMDIDLLRQELVKKDEELRLLSESNTEKFNSLEEKLKSSEEEIERLDVDLSISLVMVIEEFTASKTQLESMLAQRQILIQCIEAIEEELNEKVRLLQDKDVQIQALSSDVQILRLKEKSLR